ncbi:MAG: DUF2785 domain-containing protein [Pseudomonadota bacterium]
MRRGFLFNLLTLLSWLAVAQPLRAACPPPDHDGISLDALKTAGFEIADDSRRQAFALALLPCLGDPDPRLRDGIAFEAYYTWLRADRLDAATRTVLLERLGVLIEPEPADRDGFRQPFAALALSEVARTDRVKPWLTPEQRATLVAQATRYLASVRDYRGFDPKEGWRHGVAHGADLVLQLVLNPAVDRAGLDRLMSAVAAQVAPLGEHSYIDGESERLARPVLFAAQRGLLNAGEWEQWLRALAAAPLSVSKQDAFRTRAGLARHHNLNAFLYALYVNARESGDANMQALVPGLQAVLKLQ